MKGGRKEVRKDEWGRKGGFSLSIIILHVSISFFLPQQQGENMNKNI